jgi:hypothetical protein
MKAEVLFHEKRIMQSAINDQLAVAGLRIWKVLKSKDYPYARKYSLFLVVACNVVVGFDNHKPKGPVASW